MVRGSWSGARRDLRRHRHYDQQFGGYPDAKLHFGGFLAADDEDWHRALDLNLFSAIRATRAALPIMTERGGGQRSAVIGRKEANIRSR